MRNFKKKLAVIACAAMLIVMAVGGSTIAYFTDTDSKTNTFTYGKVDVTLLENGADNTVPFEKTGFLPITNVGNPTLDVNYVPKDVKIRNDGITNAYIRTFIAVPSDLYTSGALHLVFGGDVSTRGWDLSGIYERYIGTGTENIYVVLAYTYQQSVGQGIRTESLLKGVYTDAKADVRNNEVIMWNTAGDMSGGYTPTEYNLSGDRQFNIYVNTQAVQADGFSSPEAAFTAAFGDKDPLGTPIEVQSGIPYPAE